MIKEKNFISAIVYMHNCSNQIGNFLMEVDNTLRTNFANYEIICVDDASSDNSIETVKKCAENINSTSINIVHMSYYQGLELSMHAGIDLSIGDFVYEFDSINIDYPLSLLMDCYKCALQGYDIITIGPKKVSKLTSKLFYKMFNMFSHSNYHMRSETVNFLSRRAINRVDSLSQTIPYRKALYARSGLNLTFMEYESNNCIYNDSNRLINNNRRETAIDAMIIFTDVADSLAEGFALFMILITLGIAFYIVLGYFGKYHPIEGWMSLMGFICFGFFGIFLLTAILIKYLSLNLRLLFKKQEYLVAEIEKVKG